MPSIRPCFLGKRMPIPLEKLGCVGFNATQWALRVSYRLQSVWCSCYQLFWLWSGSLLSHIHKGLWKGLVGFEAPNYTQSTCFDRTFARRVRAKWSWDCAVKWICRGGNTRRLWLILQRFHRERFERHCLHKKTASSCPDLQFESRLSIYSSSFYTYS